jgi:hypothetical protein
MSFAATDWMVCSIRYTPLRGDYPILIARENAARICIVGRLAAIIRGEDSLGV